MAAAGDRLAARLSPWERLKAYDTGITPEVALNRVLAAASSSDGQRRLFETMISRDADLGNAVDQRTLAFAGARWRFEPREGVTPRAAAAVLKALPQDLLTQLTLEHAALFRLFGYAVLEIEWEPDWSARSVHTLPFAATYVEQGRIMITVGGSKAIPADDPQLAPRLVVIRADEHDPASAARLRRCVGLWVTKAYLARDWRRYLERYGNPWKVGHYPRGAPPSADGKTAQAAVLEALEALEGNAVAAIPDDVKAELLSEARGDATLAFDRLWTRCNEGIYNAILGQNSTVEQGKDGARSSDEVRERVLDAIVEADARVVAGEIDRQLVQVVERAKAAGRQLAHCVFSWERETPQSERADIMVKANTAGIEFDHDAAREELGLEAPTPEQLAAKAEAQAAVAAALAGAGEDEGEDQEQPGAMSRLWRRVAALFRATPPTRSGHALRAGEGTIHQALDGIGDASLRAFRRAIEQHLMAAVRDELHDDMTPAEVERALQKALTADRVSPLAEVFEDALLAARLNGRLLAAAQLERLRRRKER
ncbi:MAG: phage portal protein family protein [Acidobacteriota bacterium]